MTALETTSTDLPLLHPLVDLQADVNTLREVVVADVTRQFIEIEKIMGEHDISTLTVNGNMYAIAEYTRQSKMRRRGARYPKLGSLVLVDDSADIRQLYTVIEDYFDPCHYVITNIAGFDHKTTGMTWGPPAVDKIGPDIKALTEALMTALAQTQERYRQTAADVAASGALLNQ